MRAKKTKCDLSLPSWKRELKFFISHWIHLRSGRFLHGSVNWNSHSRWPVCTGYVASFMEAWIEILCLSWRFRSYGGSLPSWKRELKCALSNLTKASEASLPSWKRELKSLSPTPLRCVNLSLPSWKRELKCALSNLTKVNEASLPSWKRELK